MIPDRIYHMIGEAYAQTGGPELTPDQRNYIAVAIYLVSSKQAHHINVLRMLDFWETFEGSEQYALAGMCRELADCGTLL
jgi:hypothetical protein